MAPMVGSWEMESLDDPSKWFLLARGYLNGGIVLCEQIVCGRLVNSFAHGMVAMGLAHHAIELFYKGVIHQATGTLPKASHDLQALEQEARKIAPDLMSSFTSPFGFEDVPASADVKAAQEAYSKRQDQRFRYLHDFEGKSWAGVHGFLPENFLEELKYCKLQFDSLIEPLSDT